MNVYNTISLASITKEKGALFQEHLITFFSFIFKLISPARSIFNIKHPIFPRLLITEEIFNQKIKNLLSSKRTKERGSLAYDI